METTLPHASRVGREKTPREKNHLLVLPGTEGMSEYRDRRFHLIAALKGSPLIIFVGLATGCLAALLA
ncbi:hypothetical protein GCM10018780_88290 [Streptomyces lanatus]|nr:hypothetical protein GCM10018780_88290 [Streptomyces lanatus]